MNVDLNNIDDMFFDSLENIEVKPSATVKEKIKKRMFYHNLMKNIYLQMGTFAFFTIMLTSFIWFYTNSSINNIAETVDATNKIEDNSNIRKDNLITESSNKINTTNSISNPSLKSDNKTENGFTKSTNKTISEKSASTPILIAENNNKTEVEIEKQDKLITDNTELKNIQTKEIAPIEKKQKITKTNIVLPKNTVVSQNNSSVKPKIVETAFIAEHPIANNSTHENTIENKSIIEQEVFQEKQITKQSNISFLDYKTSVLLSQKINTQTLELPELQIPDDTVGYNMNNEPIVLPSNHWYVDLYFAPNYSNSNFKNNSSEFAVISDKLNSETNSAFGYNIGINAGYKFKNFAVNLGVAYSEFNQKLDAKYNEQALTNVNYYDYTTTNEWQLDTTFYWNLDSLIQGDSVMTPIIDSTQITLLDSTMETRVDTSLEEKTALKTNKYKYVEFPLTVEYVFNRGKKLSPFINGGLITGLLIKTSTYTYQTSNGALIQDNNTPYIKPNLWLVFGAGVRYNVNNKYSLMVYPYYRYNLKSIIESTNIYGQKINIFGVNFGVRYTF